MPSPPALRAPGGGARQPQAPPGPLPHPAVMLCPPVHASRLFQPVQYGQKPEGRTVAFPSTHPPRTATSTAATATPQSHIRGRPPIATFSANPDAKGVSRARGACATRVQGGASWALELAAAGSGVCGRRWGCSRGASGSSGLGPPRRRLLCSCPAFPSPDPAGRRTGRPQVTRAVLQPAGPGAACQPGRRTDTASSALRCLRPLLARPRRNSPQRRQDHAPVCGPRWLPESCSLEAA